MVPNNSRIDLSFLQNFTSQDEEKVRYYIQIYIKTATQMFGELEKSMDTISNEDLYARIHSLKPQTRYVGIIGLTELLVEIEMAIKNKSNREVIRQKLEAAINLNKLGMQELESHYLAEKNF